MNHNLVFKRNILLIALNEERSPSPIFNTHKYTEKASIIQINFEFFQKKSPHEADCKIALSYVKVSTEVLRNRKLTLR